ncbi:multidrug transporter MatE [Ruminococcus sp. OA3]|uniref:MATE family efflux transporter n=1 Tax=Ruminococcus sp. OA3 TaxID=2914164 RepID=UPI001F0599A4|nr:MATE family efflux transporter [Ruminococcus sp. OA3]MCH1981764.1 multidrug transporter MatE [Ruminococcus sp. OA3]
MNLLQGKIRTVYFKYLAAAFGSAMISSIYGLVDMAMVGQYQGPNGTAALAVVAPVWNIIYSLGLLTGIGGSVLFATEKGRNRSGTDSANAYFTVALVGTVVFAAVSWLGIIFFDRQLLTLFGAEETLLPLARQYLLPVKFAVPLFLFNQMLAAFLRNDGNPGLATAGVLAGGIFNIAGDYIFVFSLDMGIFGAGLATALGALITFLVMGTHFLTKKCSLRLVWPVQAAGKLRRVIVTGFSTFFIDIAMGILTMLFNRQIMRYLGSDALAVYGIIVNISTIVQCCAYSVGQAAQPVISMNFGAGKWGRIRETLKYALLSAGFFSVVWTAAIIGFPNVFVRIFMAPTEAVLEIAPFIIRCYGISFLLLPLNIFSTYYFQALMKPAASFLVSFARGTLISGILIYVLPAAAGANAMWFAMPLTELLLAVPVIWLIARYTRGLGRA